MIMTLLKMDQAGSRPASKMLMPFSCLFNLEGNLNFGHLLRKDNGFVLTIVWCFDQFYLL